jgi:hypothetical protein
LSLYLIMLFKKTVLSIIIAAFTPIAFVFVLVFTLASYHKNHAVNMVAFSHHNIIAYAALPTSQNTFAANISEQDGRVEKIRQFLHRYNSPLEPYAQDVVDAADEYGLDYRLIPAIAMQESNLCLKIPTDSYNCWGFGIYGSNVHRFSDYKEGIYTVTKTLANKYKTKGLVTPEQIMTMWTPSSNGSWAHSVNYFMEKLN